MKIIGLTGGIGVGKTTIANILNKEFEAYVIYTDLIGHEVMRKNEPSYECIIKEFGTSILDDQGEIDRKKLGGVIFHNKEKRQKLNECTHPFIRTYIQGMLSVLKEQKKIHYIIIEAALLLESGFDALCDEVWNVTADKNIRIQRLISSRDITIERIENIMKAQVTEIEYLEKCDFTIINDNIEYSRNQIRKRLENMEVNLNGQA